MASTDLLRKLIREEVRAVFQEELAGILKEAITQNKGSNVMTEVEKPKKSAVPGTLNTKPFRPVASPDLGKSNPLTNILAETARSMTFEEADGFSFDSSNAQGFGYIQKEAPVVDSVDDMMSTARASSNFDAIQINAVPDYSQLMANLKAKGAI